jgi:hypothetical protein
LICLLLEILLSSIVVTGNEWVCWLVFDIVVGTRLVGDMVVEAKDWLLWFSVW